MKKTILIVIMVALVTTPCIAQEVETDGIFSLHGTLWKALPIGISILPFPWIWNTNGLEFGFYGGEGYIDMLVFSIFNTGHSLSTCLTGGGSTNYFGILQPIGIGIFVESYVSSSPGVPTELKIGFLIKISDHWMPPEFGYISPNQGEQGTTLTNITITGINTTFQDGNIVDVQFSPDGEVISNIRTISNTEIKFDLELETDAEIGFRTVTVIWDDGRKHITGIDAFEVLEQTN